MKMIHKHLPLQLKADTDTRIVEGYASTFGNIDSDGDIIAPGAFMDSIKLRKPKMLWQHRSDQPCGVWTDANETPQGLYVRGQIADTQLGNDAHKLALLGAVDSMSIGFAIEKCTYDEKGIRTIHKADLWEVSLVTFPANNQAKITRVKSASDEIDAAVSLLSQCVSMCQLAVEGTQPMTAESCGVVVQMIQSALSYLDEPEEEVESQPMTAPEGDTIALSKGKPKDIRALEKLLCDAGFSRREAKAISAGGYKAIAGQRDVDGQELIKTLENAINILKG